MKINNKLKESILQQIDRAGIESIGLFCVLTMVPMVDAYEFIKDAIPEHKEFCNKKIKAIKKFYGEDV